MIARRVLVAAGVAALAGAGPAAAAEGMWTADQLPALGRELTRLGLQLDASELADLKQPPLAAVVSMGGCTGSFVSSRGLVLTNHHCARGSVQYNSTTQHNYLRDGFLARHLEEEVRASPATRIFVTVGVQDVTPQMRAALEAIGSDTERHEEVERRRIVLLRTCERKPGRRCELSELDGGLRFVLTERIEIRDVRLVYAPPDSIGRYGGDVDNWMWPRHVGDFAFFRAYVAPDGQPADYAKQNVPYRPPHHLRIAARGVREGDFIFAAGYPSVTRRASRLAEVRHAFEWRYPMSIELYRSSISAIEAGAAPGSAARIMYEPLLAAFNNRMKNMRGQLDGALRLHLIDRRMARRSDLAAWLDAKPARNRQKLAVRDLDVALRAAASMDRRAFWLEHLTGAQPLSTAVDLYRLAREREKPPARRARGFQERDLARFRHRLATLDRRFDASIERARWLKLLEIYLRQPRQERLAAFDAALGLDRAADLRAVRTKLGRYYELTELSASRARLAWVDRDVRAFEASDDPFIELAVALYPVGEQMREEQERLDGKLRLLRPAYMEALNAWRASEGIRSYPDANSTLRITYGRVSRRPQDRSAFTTLDEILSKDTGHEPFAAPKRLLDLARAEDEGSYAEPELGSVPVNFLSDLDTTGGNSGSPTLNARGELVGLLFDSTLESVISDWSYDAQHSGKIHVDIRYLLWLLEKYAHADALIAELDLDGRNRSTSSRTAAPAGSQ